MTDYVEIKDEGNIIEVVQGRDLTVCKIVKSDLEMENVKFIQLADTPDNYQGSANKVVKVNNDETGLIFSDAYETFISLTDTPPSYDGNENKLVVVNKEGTGLSFVNYNAGDVEIEYFTQLADTPSSYQNASGKVAAVKQTADGLEFKNVNDLLTTQSIGAGVYSYPIVTVNSKGIITNIENGVPFEFPPFTANNLLIGDGTKTPAEVQHGTTNQVLITTTNTGTVNWQWLDGLYDSNGHKLLYVSAYSSSSYSSLAVITDSTSVKIAQEDSTDSLILGNSNAVTITNQETNIINDVVLSGTNKIETNGYLSLKPVNTVRIDPSLDAQSYANRITDDNDFITLKYLQSHQINTDNLLKRTSSNAISDNTVVYTLPVNGETSSILLNVTDMFNEDASLMIQDSLGNILIDESELPGISDVGLVRIDLDVTSPSDDYQITVSVNNYAYGSGNVYMTYF